MRDLYQNTVEPEWYSSSKPVLRILDVYPGSWFLSIQARIPTPEIKEGEIILLAYFFVAANFTQ